MSRTSTKPVETSTKPVETSTKPVETVNYTVKSIYGGGGVRVFLDNKEIIRDGRIGTSVTQYQMIQSCKRMVTAKINKHGLSLSEALVELKGVLIENGQPSGIINAILFLVSYRHKNKGSISGKKTDYSVKF